MAPLALEKLRQCLKWHLAKVVETFVIIHQDIFTELHTIALELQWFTVTYYITLEWQKKKKKLHLWAWFSVPIHLRCGLCQTSVIFPDNVCNMLYWSWSMQFANCHKLIALIMEIRYLKIWNLWEHANDNHAYKSTHEKSNSAVNFQELLMTQVSFTTDYYLLGRFLGQLSMVAPSRMRVQQ